MVILSERRKHHLLLITIVLFSRFNAIRAKNVCTKLAGEINALIVQDIRHFELKMALSSYPHVFTCTRKVTVA